MREVPVIGHLDRSEGGLGEFRFDVDGGWEGRGSVQDDEGVSAPKLCASEVDGLGIHPGTVADQIMERAGQDWGGTESVGVRAGKENGERQKGVHGKKAVLAAGRGEFEAVHEAILRCGGYQRRFRRGTPHHQAPRLLRDEVVEPAKDVRILSPGGGDEDRKIAKICRRADQLERRHRLGDALGVVSVESAREVGDRERAARADGEEGKASQAAERPNDAVERMFHGPIESGRQGI
ncbi:MAG: hypothetical protein P4L84_19560 [Isosphaeraceae bacterium]|nr:hypothetical protein [Isosphaeraceae bacterium]